MSDIGGIGSTVNVGQPPTSEPKRPEPDTQRFYADQYVGRAISDVGITSGDKYYSWLRDQNLGVTRDIARTAWKEYNVSNGYKDVLAVWPGNSPIPRAWYSETDQKGIDKYVYKMTMYLTYTDTGDSFQSTYTIHSDKALNSVQIQDQIMNGIENSSPGQYSSISGFAFESIYHKTGAKW